MTANFVMNLIFTDVMQPASCLRSFLQESAVEKIIDALCHTRTGLWRARNVSK